MDHCASAPTLTIEQGGREAGKRGLTERFRGPWGEIVASSNRVTSNQVAKDVTMPKRDRVEYMRQYRVVSNFEIWRLR